MNRLTASILSILSLIVLLGPAEALTIYPVDRAEILAGSKFDLKVEFDGLVASGDVRIIVNGVDHARLLGCPAQFIAREQGADQSADGKSRKHDDGQRTDADQVGLLQHVAPIPRMFEQVGNRAPHQQRVFLDGQHFFLGKLRGRDKVDTTEEISGSHACILRRY